MAKRRVRTKSYDDILDQRDRIIAALDTNRAIPVDRYMSLLRGVQRTAARYGNNIARELARRNGEKHAHYMVRSEAAEQMPNRVYLGLSGG